MSRYFSKRSFKRRMKEPSTLAGLAILASVFGESLGIPPAIAEAVVIAAGAGAVVLPESAPSTPSAGE